MAARARSGPLESDSMRLTLLLWQSVVREFKMKDRDFEMEDQLPRINHDKITHGMWSCDECSCNHIGQIYNE